MEYPLSGLPTEQVRVVTHVYSLLGDERKTAVFHAEHDARLLLIMIKPTATPWFSI